METPTQIVTISNFQGYEPSNPIRIRQIFLSVSAESIIPQDFVEIDIQFEGAGSAAGNTAGMSDTFKFKLYTTDLPNGGQCTYVYQLTNLNLICNRVKNGVQATLTSQVLEANLTLIFENLAPN